MSKLNIDSYAFAVQDKLEDSKRFYDRFKNLEEGDSLDIGNIVDQNILAKFFTTKVPETFIFDQNGQLLKKFVGPQEWDNPAIYKSIERSLKVK